MLNHPIVAPSPPSPPPLPAFFSQLTLVAVFIDLIYLTLIILPIAFMYATLLVTTCGYSTEELSSLDQAGGQVKALLLVCSLYK